MLDLGLPVTVMAVLIVVFWIVGIWTLVKDESGLAANVTRLLLVGIVLFLGWRFAGPLFL